jgi:hypothetical protein
MYEVAGVLRETGRPAVAYMVTPDKERRYVGGAFIALNQQMRAAMGARPKGQGQACQGRRRQARHGVGEAGDPRPREAPQGRGEAAARDAARV